jgi:amidophosphoribosyltransferase
MCGFIGIYGVEGGNVVRQIYDGLLAIQHRGQDAAGILTFDGVRFHLVKGTGLVRDIFDEGNTASLKGDVGLGHVRYPTIGAGNGEDAQPFFMTAPYGVGMAHNGNVINYASLKEDLHCRDHHHLNSSCDVEIIMNVFARELRKAEAEALTPDVIYRAAQSVFDRVEGSYSVVAYVIGGGMVAFRDPHGIKPIIMGERRIGDKVAYCIASESVALDMLDFHHTSNIQPGEVVFIDEARQVHRKRLVEKEHRPCIFEWIYFARPDSFIDKISVYKTRLRLGEHLGDRWLAVGGPKPDVVIPVPESARPAAIAMAKKLDVPYREGLVKNRYIGRTFIMPGQVNRRLFVRQKLNAIHLEFQDKDVLLVDDSIVRGNTVRELIEIARQAGARKVYFASYSAPLSYPCFYGIDMMTRGEFIARNRAVESIRQLVGADYLLYQEVEDMMRAAKEGNPELQNFCAACFTGDYPTGALPEELLEAIERERMIIQQEFAFEPRPLIEPRGY